MNHRSPKSSSGDQQVDRDQDACVVGRLLDSVVLHLAQQEGIEGGVFRDERRKRHVEVAHQRLWLGGGRRRFAAHFVTGLGGQLRARFGERAIDARAADNRLFDVVVQEQPIESIPRDLFGGRTLGEDPQEADNDNQDQQEPDRGDAAGPRCALV